MKFMKLYLVGYFVLLVGAGLALWQAGVLDDISGIWLAIGIIVAVGFGIMLAVSSSPRADRQGLTATGRHGRVPRDIPLIGRCRCHLCRRLPRRGQHPDLRPHIQRRHAGRQGALANALQTKKGSWIPWSRKRYFDRRAFEADLKRIEAFYRDRGFPDARVRSFDVKLNDQQDQVDITARHQRRRTDTRRIDRRPRVRRHAAPTSSARCSETLPLQPGRPLDRQLATASRERALNVLRDEGYPYAEVTLVEEEAGPTASQVDARGRAWRAGEVRRNRHPGICQR